jgi:glycosyltransferase involved in cell wall biosynthesis
MPSENEGFGLVYAEAMAHGLPCIASTRDAAGEVVRDGETGLLVPVRDPAALAEAIHRLVSEPGLGTRMGAAGRRRFEALFTPEKYRERLLAMMADWHRSTRSRP